LVEGGNAGKRHGGINSRIRRTKIKRADGLEEKLEDEDSEM
jgi:hypothetical protein